MSEIVRLTHERTYKKNEYIFKKLAPAEGMYVILDGTVEIMLADEISPDNCRLWDAETSEKMDKDRFRRDLGGLLEAYQEIARRLGVKIPQID